jgi:hypothetical protein
LFSAEVSSFAQTPQWEIIYSTPFLPCPISRNARPCRAGLTEYVITHGIAENPFGVTSSAANAADASPANAHDGKMCGRGDAIECL